MKSFGIAIIAMLALVAFSYGHFTAAVKTNNTDRFDELARRVINTSAGVKPGDVVVISGGKHTLPLMEALAIEAQKAGGMVEMNLYSERVTRSLLTEVPEHYLEQKPSYYAEWLKQVDVWINLPGAEDPRALYAGVPEARLAKIAEAGKFLEELANQMKVRDIYIAYPTREMATNSQIDFATLEKMHWDALGADYQQIAAKGEALRKILSGAKGVRVTSDAGTDFSFMVGERPVFVDDGVFTKEEVQGKFYLNRFTSLPSGRVYFAPLETSANGKVIIPRSLCKLTPMVGISFDFRAGWTQNFKAEKGSTCFAETMAPYDGPKDRFAGISIGLNPALRVIENPGDYRPGTAAGMVWIRIGSNELEGGNNKTTGGYGFPIVRATVEVDGKKIIKNGQLIF